MSAPRPKVSRGIWASVRNKTLKKRHKKPGGEPEDAVLLSQQEVKILYGRLRVILAHIESNAVESELSPLSSSGVSAEAKEAAQLLVEALVNDDTIHLVKSLQSMNCATLGAVVKLVFMSSAEPLIPGRVCSLILATCSKYAEYLHEKDDEKVEEIGATLERFSASANFTILEGLCQSLSRLPMPNDELAYVFAPLVLLPKLGMLSPEEVPHEEIDANLELLAAADAVIEAMEFLIYKAETLFDSRSRKRALLKKGFSARHANGGRDAGDQDCSDDDPAALVSLDEEEDLASALDALGALGDDPACSDPSSATSSSSPRASTPPQSYAQAAARQAPPIPGAERPKLESNRQSSTLSGRDGGDEMDVKPTLARITRGADELDGLEGSGIPSKERSMRRPADKGRDLPRTAEAQASVLAAANPRAPGAAKSARGRTDGQNVQVSDAIDASVSKGPREGPGDDGTRPGASPKSPRPPKPPCRYGPEGDGAERGPPSPPRSQEQYIMRTLSLTMPPALNAPQLPSSMKASDSSAAAAAIASFAAAASESDSDSGSDTGHDTDSVSESTTGSANAGSRAGVSASSARARRPSAAAAQAFGEIASASASFADDDQSFFGGAHLDNAFDDFDQKQPVCTAVVLFDYDPHEDGEIALVQGEIVQVLEIEEDGWWYGRAANGDVGVFPGVYVQRSPSLGERASEAGSMTDDTSAVVTSLTPRSAASTSTRSPISAARSAKDSHGALASLLQVYNRLAHHADLAAGERNKPPPPAHQAGAAVQVLLSKVLAKLQQVEAENAELRQRLEGLGAE